MLSLKYIANYPPEIIAQIESLIEQNKLADFLLKKYPNPHQIISDKELREFTLTIKNKFIKKSAPLSKVIYDNKLHVVKNALGLHTYVSKNHGGKLKSKNEIRIASAFKHAPEAFLSMIVVHELAHLKEKEHNKPFYKLCEHMLPNYHQLEFEMRVYLTQLEVIGPIY